MNTDQDWRSSASCLSVGPEPFFPDSNEGGDTRRAQMICARCDVRTECLQEALDNSEEAGIWGGLTPQQRWKLKRGEPVLQPKPCVVCDRDFFPRRGTSQHCSVRCYQTTRRVRVRAELLAAREGVAS